MIYITLANFKRIIPDPDKREFWSKILIPSSSGIYPDKRINQLLDEDELKRLFFSKLLFSEHESEDLSQIKRDMLSQEWLKVITPLDNYRKIYPPHTPKFHTDKNCTALKGDYVNYELPYDFKEKYAGGGGVP